MALGKHGECCGERGDQTRQHRARKASRGRLVAALVCLATLGLASVEPALAEQPANVAEESDEAIELRTMGPRDGGPVYSDCGVLYHQVDVSAVCVALSPALLASLRGVTRAEAAKIMGSSGRVYMSSLRYSGNYANSYPTSTTGETGNLRLYFEDKKVVRVEADLWGERRHVLSYIWSHFPGHEEHFCSDLPEINKPCQWGTPQ